MRTTLLLAASAALTLSAAAQAPIERHYRSGPTTTVPAEGIRITAEGKLETVRREPGHTELRLTHGTATVTVNHPSEDALILIDLPGGQADLVRDGVYQLNADTNSLTVLRGEADVFPLGAPPDAKGTTTKEGQQVTLGPNPHPQYTAEAHAASRELRGDGDGRYYGGGGYGYGSGFYGDGFYGAYPYYGYGWGGWGYPYYGYGYGYPAIGIGIGYGWGGWGYGRGFYRGGFGGYRGGFGRGFHR